MEEFVNQFYVIVQADGEVMIVTNEVDLIDYYDCATLTTFMVKVPSVGKRLKVAEKVNTEHGGHYFQFRERTEEEEYAFWKRELQAEIYEEKERIMKANPSYTEEYAQQLAEQEWIK